MNSALRDCRILDTAPEPAFDALAARAARAARTPFALIALHDGERLWFKAAVGARSQETEAESVAREMLAADGVVWISDCLKHKAHATNAWVTGPPHVRFCAGAPLKLASGEAVGFLCVIGLEPRRRSPRLVRELEELAAIAAALIDARRQRTLREESDRLRALAEAEAGVGFWRIDRETNTGWWSPGVFSLFGRDPALGPASPADYKPIAPPGTWDGWKDFIRRATTTRESFTTHLPLKPPDAPLRRLKIVCVADSREADVSHGIVIDETATLAALESVQAQQRLLDSFIDHAPAALAMFDRDMRYLRASPQWRRDYNLGDIDLVGRSHYEIFPEIGDGWKAIHQRCLQGAIESNPREVFVRADGSTQYLAWEVRPWRDATGDIGGLMMMTRDLTKEVETVIALERTSERLVQALDIGRAYMWEFDTATNRIYVNGDPEAVMGFAMPEVRDPIDVFGIVHPDDRAAAIAHWRAHIKTGAPYRIEHRTAVGDGGERWVLAVSEAKRAPDGWVTGSVGLVQDITARKLAEIEISAARDAAEAANASKSEFLATISHEIRTPLNGVLGMAHALERSTLSAEQRKLLHSIIESGDTLLRLLNDLLDGARIEAGQLSLAESPFDLGDILESVHALTRERAAAKGVTLDFDCDPQARAYVGDPLRVKQILLNLVSNAVKFTERGGVRVEVRRTAAGAGDQLTFRVVDSGIGFDEETRARLFRRFSQADLQTTRRFGGSGLGLAISRGLVELMGGTIDCRSAPGRGSEFWFTLTLPRAAQSDPDAREARASSSGLGLRVLCAEDHPINRKVVELLLSTMGCHTSFAENGQEAVDIWELGVFDIVLMDLHMPEMDGETATRIIRARETETGRVRTPILALTANASEQHVAACLEAGMDGHIAKPFRPEELVTAMRHAMAHREAREDSARKGAL